MFKDYISLQKENRQKRNIIKQLETTNKDLKGEYEQCIRSNRKIQYFLRDIEFTFKNDKKQQKANEIMTKAKKLLYQEAQQTKNEMKKIVKSSQASNVQ